MDNGSNRLDDHGDLRKIGNSSPRYHYGINFSANWNGIDFAVFFQGVGKRDWYPAGESGLFWGQYNRAYGYSRRGRTPTAGRRTPPTHTGPACAARWPPADAARCAPPTTATCRKRATAA